MGGFFLLFSNLQLIPPPQGDCHERRPHKHPSPTRKRNTPLSKNNLLPAEQPERLPLRSPRRNSPTLPRRDAVFRLFRLRSTGSRSGRRHRCALRRTREGKFSPYVLWSHIKKRPPTKYGLAGDIVFIPFPKGMRRALARTNPRMAASHHRPKSMRRDPLSEYGTSIATDRLHRVR